MNKPNKTQSDIKYIILLLIIAILVITNCVTIRIYIKTYDINESIKIEECGDEISRAKFFIIDWYNELSSINNIPHVYYNEIRFNAGEYTLTVFADRIRAVYPRGSRFFQLEHITYIEFYKQDNVINCKMYFLESGEIVFKIN